MRKKLQELEVNQVQELETIDAETLLENPLAQVEYIIEDILPIGLHLFCGASKIGKSWLIIDLKNIIS